MNIIVYLITGAIVGSIASRLMRTNSWLGLLVNIIVGSVGAFLAGYFINPLLSGTGTARDAITIPTLLVTLMGSIAMVWIVKAVHNHEAGDHPVLDTGQTNRQE